jgi:hypothetical protein
MEMKEIKSSAIRRIGHDPETNTLAVEFHGGTLYHFDNVTANEHSALLASPSIGRHFTNHFGKRVGKKQEPSSSRRE